MKMKLCSELPEIFHDVNHEVKTELANTIYKYLVQINVFLCLQYIILKM